MTRTCNQPGCDHSVYTAGVCYMHWQLLQERVEGKPRFSFKAENGIEIAETANFTPQAMTNMRLQGWRKLEGDQHRAVWRRVAEVESAAH